MINGRSWQVRIMGVQRNGVGRREKEGKERKGKMTERK